MKVLFLTHQFLPRAVGGTELYTLGLAQALLGLGHQPRVVTYVESPSNRTEAFVPEDGEVEGVAFTEIPFNLSVASRPARAEYANVFTAARVAQVLKREKPSLVHATHLMKLGAACVAPVNEAGVPFIATLTDFWSICGRHTLLRSNGRLCQGPRHTLDCVPCLRDTHGFTRARFWPGRDVGSRDLARQAVASGNLWPRDVVGDWLAIAGRNPYLRRALAGARRLVVLSEFQKALLVRNGIPAENMEVVPHGNAEGSMRFKGASPDRPPTFVYAASLTHHKGLHIALQAMERVPDLSVRLEIHGESRPDDPFVETLRARSQADPRVSWRGVFRPQDLPGILRGSLALLVPVLWYENNPLSVQLALALGVRVVGSRLGTVEELVGSAPGHLLVPPGDPAALAEAMGRVANGEIRPPSPRHDLPTWEAHVRRIMEIYRRGGAVTDLHLTDLLDRSEIEAPQPDHVGVERVTIHGDTRSVLFQHPDSSVAFPAVRVDRGAKLRFSIGVRQTAWDRLLSPILFTLALAGPFGTRRRLFRFRLDPAREPAHRAWLEFEVDLPVRPAGMARLVFETRVPRHASPAYAWAAWADPLLVGWHPAPASRIRRAAKTVVLVTCDALRRDTLGCYGHPEIETPHIDSLAADGWLFEGARTCSPSTIASVASLACGVHPARLGLDSEWGVPPPESMTLVRSFAAAGFQTVLAASEHDHLGQPCGGGAAFDAVVPLLGRPDQDGAQTTRRLLDWLHRSDDRPRMVWIQYFELAPAVAGSDGLGPALPPTSKGPPGLAFADRHPRGGGGAGDRSGAAPAAAGLRRCRAGVAPAGDRRRS